MRIFIERTGKQLSRKFNGKAAELLKLLKINPETVLVAKNNKLVTDDENLEDADEVKILSVISGG